MTDVHDKTKRKRRHLTNLTIREVSLCALGANQPARIVMFKRADSGPHVAMSEAVTVAMSVDELRAKIESNEAETATLKAQAYTAAHERDEALYELSVLSPTEDRTKDRADAEREYDAMIRRTLQTYPTLTREQAAELVLRTVPGQLVYDRMR
jgi:hypothetical protein